MSCNLSNKLLHYLPFRNTRRVYFSATSLCYRQIVYAPCHIRLTIPRLYTCTTRLCKEISTEHSDVVSTSKSNSEYGLNGNKVTVPANLNIEQYHMLADSYLSELEEKLLDLQEKNEGVDLDFSAGVLTLTLPLKGVYVLNKQPPNKQIWLSSPISGPRRFDYVICTEGKEDLKCMGSGQWLCMRDGTPLSYLLKIECQIHMPETTSE